MISKEELEKLTVLQLKEKLKSRKLLLSGAKPELISRLYESILVEDKLLGNLDIENESAGPSEFDLTNFDVDEVLGIDSEIISPNSTHKKIDLDLTLNNIHNDALKSPSKPVEPEVKKLLAKTSILAPFSPKSNALHLPLVDTNDIKKDGTVPNAKNAEEKNLGLSAEEGQKMLQISKRLGLPCKTLESLKKPEDALAKRAQRFGTATLEVSKKQARLERFGLNSFPLTDEKVAKRVQRFGVVNSNDAVNNKKAKTLSFPITDTTVSSEEAEKRRKRAERFGNGTNVN